MKYYAVKNGRETGIFTNWDDCRLRVEAFSNAKYKKFNTEAEARAYLNGEEYVKPAETEQLHFDGFEGKKDEPSSQKPCDNTAMAYVDGSYNPESNMYGSGVVLLHNGRTYELKKSGTNAELATMRNVAGEVAAALIAAEKAISLGAEKLVILHDYVGIAAWATGAWKAKNPYTISYKTKMLKYMNKIPVEFVKVEAHTGVELNERADILAKEAAGV